MQKKSERVQDANTSWFYCGEGALSGGAAGFFFGGPLGSAAGAAAGCLGFAFNESVLRKIGGSEAGDSHTRELNCMKEQISRYPIIVSKPKTTFFPGTGKARTATMNPENECTVRISTMNPEELRDLITNCPNDDAIGPCDVTIKLIKKQLQEKCHGK